jgi:RP/EB family microtubule-associated protein
MSAGDNIGMMEGAFFVPRGELMGWINELLSLNVTKVEQCATGGIYC